jgi:hypothetical protein
MIDFSSSFTDLHFVIFRFVVGKAVQFIGDASTLYPVGVTFESLTWAAYLGARCQGFPQLFLAA